MRRAVARVPEDRGSLVGGQELSIGAKYRTVVIAAFNGVLITTSILRYPADCSILGSIPKDRVVAAFGGDQSAAVRAEHQMLSRVFQRKTMRQFLARADAPEVDPLVFAAGGDLLTVRREC